MHFITEGLPLDVEEQWKLTSTRINEWLRNDVLSWNWWVMLIIFILTAVFWWKLVHKVRLNEMALYTAIIIIFIIVMDELGEELSLWYYTTNIIPVFPPITAIDITCMPLVYMLVYQYAKTWKSFIITTVIMSAVFCFVFEPIFVLSGIYKMLTWKSYYGFPIYIFIALASKFAVGKILAISSKQKINS